MNDQELQIKVAEAMGWTAVDTSTDFMGRLSGMVGGERKLVPNWPEDLPKCMAPDGPWEWLEEHTAQLTLTTWHRPQARRAYLQWLPLEHADKELASFYKDGTLAEDGAARAICHAVLAVDAKLKEGSGA